MLVFMAFAAEAAPVACNFKGSNGGYNGRVTAEYVTAAVVKMEEEKRAAAELRAPEPTSTAGRLVFVVYRPAIELADAKNYLIVLESAGVELLRYQPEPRVSVGKAMYGWTNAIVVVPEGWTAEAPLDVHLADKVFATRCDWRVSAGVLTRAQ